MLIKGFRRDSRWMTQVQMKGQKFQCKLGVGKMFIEWIDLIQIIQIKHQPNERETLFRRMCQWKRRKIDWIIAFQWMNELRHCEPHFRIFVYEKLFRSKNSIVWLIAYVSAVVMMTKVFSSIHCRIVNNSCWSPPTHVKI